MAHESGMYVCHLLYFLSVQSLNCFLELDSIIIGD